MSEVPVRLLVISARVPEGERCIPAGAKTGCQFLGVSSTHYIPRCHLYEEDMCDLDRLPACRERDGWRCYPPDSGVVELVEAAKRWEDADMQSRRAAQTHPPAGACAIYETERSRMFELLGAAHKAAESKP